MKLTPAQLVCLKAVEILEAEPTRNLQYPWPGTYFRTLDVLIREGLVEIDNYCRRVTDKGAIALAEAGDKSYIELIQDADRISDTRTKWERRERRWNGLYGRPMRAR